jgi:hypothetical protein
MDHVKAHLDGVDRVIARLAPYICPWVGQSTDAVVAIAENLYPHAMVLLGQIVKASKQPKFFQDFFYLFGKK